MPRTSVTVTGEPLSLDALCAAVADPGAGAIVTFSGVTRDVPELLYEGYAEMAEAELRRIVEQTIAGHDVLAAAAAHRLGTVPLGEASVLVAVSSAHRPAAFAASRAVIDEIKQRLPIWKREEGKWKHEGRPQPA